MVKQSSPKYKKVNGNRIRTFGGRLRLHVVSISNQERWGETALIRFKAGLIIIIAPNVHVEEKAFQICRGPGWNPAVEGVLQLLKGRVR